MKVVHCKLTQEGFSKIKSRKADLEDRLCTIDAQMNDIAMAEDTTENMEYQQLRRERISLNVEIGRLADIIENTQVIKKRSFSDIQPGCQLRLENHQLCLMFQLVSTLEANSLEGKISCSSPLGNSLIGKRVGDEVIVPTPLGKINFNIVHIS